MDQATEQPPTRLLRVLQGTAVSATSERLLADACRVALAGQPVLFLAATPIGARRMRDQILRQSPHAATNMRITTVSGWAEEVVRRSAPQLRLISVPEAQRSLLLRLETESTTESVRVLWPTLHRQINSDVHRQEMAAAVGEFRRSGRSINDLEAAPTDQSGGTQRWVEIAQFAGRWTASLRAMGLTDSLDILWQAQSIFRSDQQTFWSKTYPYVYVESFERLFPLQQQLVTGHLAEIMISVNPAGPTWRTATNHRWEEHLRLAFSQQQVEMVDPTQIDAPLREIAVLAHPSLEADTIVSALSLAYEQGTAWTDMAVVTAFTDLSLHDSLRRSARRLGVPLSGLLVEPNKNLWANVIGELIVSPSNVTDTQERIGIQLAQPVRLAIETQQSLVGRAHLVWRSIGRQVLAEADDETVQLVTAVVNRVLRGSSPSDALAAPVAVKCDGALVGPAAQMVGENRDVVVIAQAVEGVWPDPGNLGLPAFDSEYLASGEILDVPTRRHRWVREQQKRFEATVAIAQRRVLAVAAPRPGVLVSRFAETWDRVTIRLQRPDLRKQIRSAYTETENSVGCFPTGRLRLSASQLDTFENCPLNFAFQYVAGIRGEGSVSASVGTMVHAALEKFLSPDATDRENSSVEDLLTQLDRCWEPTAFPYRPQEADYRRRAEEWLRNWFANELPKLGRVIAVEHRFSIEVGEHELTGSIDRISTTKSGMIEIVDYKTGARPAGSIDEENLQLASYYLAAQKDPFLKSFGEPERLRLHYLVDGKDIDQPVTPDHIAVTSARILLDAEKILSEEYEPSIDAECEYCSFQRICPVQREGREVPTVYVHTDSPEGDRR